MTQLLVSVRNPEEAALAIAGGVDILDVKEPHRGALGAADADVIAQCAELSLEAGIACSAALGELRDVVTGANSGEFAHSAFCDDIRYAKIGLAGMASDSDWRRKWCDFWRTAPSRVSPVAVAYADHLRAAAPSPDEVMEVAAELPSRILLLDTCYKDAGGLFDLLDRASLTGIVERAHLAGMQIALAGSLQLPQAPLAQALGADIVAVRGAVCGGRRSGPISAPLVEQLKAALEGTTIVYSER